jgi:LacI family transcriptional regulator
LARPQAVSEELRGRILAAAGRLGYAPNLAARALVAGRSGLVAMLVDTLIEPLPAAAAAEMQRSLGREGYSLIIATTGGMHEEALARAREVLGRRVEALISWNVPDPSGLAEAVAAYGVPWLAFDEPGLSGPAFAATSGRRSGAILGCRYLLSLGHGRFGVVATPGAGIREAVRAVLAGSGAMLHETDAVAHGADLDGAQAAVGRLLDGGQATAILCGSDLLAMAALRECRARGVSVPDEVSLVGFGDSLPARCSAPALTSVRVSAEEIGVRTTEALMLMLGGGAPSPVEPTLKLVIRESTGPCPPDEGWRCST